MIWLGERAMTHMEVVYTNRVRKAGNHLVRAWRKRVSIRVARSGGTVIRSKPGEAPRRDTGRLYNSIGQSYVLGRPATRVGTNVSYAKHLEFGTSRMAARPSLRPVFANERPTLVAIITTGHTGQTGGVAA